MEKRNMYAAILALTACLLVLVLAVAIGQQVRTDPLEYVQFREKVQGMTLVPWFEEDVGYLFLPAYAGPEDVQITTTAGVTAVFQDDETLEVKTPFRTRAYTIRFRQNTNLPTLSLTSESGTLDYIHSSLDHEKDVFATLTDENGNTLLRQVATMSGRGNATWAGEKRPYNLDFSQPVQAEPFQGIKSLSLLSEIYDESKLRNSLAYFAGRELGIAYTSGYMHCNLYIDGEYRGLYGIATKEEYTKFIDRDGIQAVFEYTGFPKDNQFYSYPGLKPIRVLYGNLEEVSYVVNDFCEALHAQDWQWCAERMDLESYARKYAMDQFFLNRDMCYSSQFFYIDDQDVIHAMLPWDFDWSMGSCNTYYRIPAPSNILMNDPPDYWGSLLQANPAFSEAIVREMETCYTDEFFDKLAVHMDDTIVRIADSFENDVARWGAAPLPNYYGQTPDIAHLELLSREFRQFYPRRRDFFLRHFGAYGGAVAEADLSQEVEGETLVMLGLPTPQPPAEEETAEAAPGTPWGKLAIVTAAALCALTLLGFEIVRNHTPGKKKDEVTV